MHTLTCNTDVYCILLHEEERVMTNRDTVQLECTGESCGEMYFPYFFVSKRHYPMVSPPASYTGSAGFKLYPGDWLS
jgi:hypothetical protein